MTFEELFVGKEVEVVLEDYQATNPPPGVTYPNEGVLVSYDGNGVVLQRKRAKEGEQLAFFPFNTIRCIRRKGAVQLVRPPLDENTVVTNAGVLPPGIPRVKKG